MMKPIDKLTRILNLEAEKYQDRAVFGGLARYADTWLQEAESAFGPGADEWARDVAGRLRAYADLSGNVARRKALTALLKMVQSPPTPEPSPAQQDEDVDEEKEEQTAAPAPKPPSTLPTPTYAHTGLDSPVAALRGVGSRQSERLGRLGVQTIRDMLYLFPHRYDDYSQLKPVNLLEYGEDVTLIAQVKEAHVRQMRNGRSLFKVILSDGTGSIEVTWFNQPYLADKIRRGRQIVVSGRVDEYLDRLCFTCPAWELMQEELLHTARIVPVYPLTKGIGAKWMRGLMKRTVDYWPKRLPDHLPDLVVREAGLLDLETAITQIHFPDDNDLLKRARHRLAFDELFVLQIGLLHRRHLWRSEPGKRLPVDDGALNNFVRRLPFELTDAQQRALRQIVADLRSDRPMNRLLQGDVGSGKTVVAAAAMALTVAAGGFFAQTATTEIRLNRPGGADGAHRDTGRAALCEPQISNPQSQAAYRQRHRAGARGNLRRAGRRQRGRRRGHPRADPGKRAVQVVGPDGD